jgi:antitoxin ParD1/3/4
MKISLPTELKKWVDAQVKAGGYDTASEYLQEMLRCERDARRKIDGLLLAALKGGAKTVMNDVDWKSIRKAATAAVTSRTKTKR